MILSVLTHYRCRYEILTCAKSNLLHACVTSTLMLQTSTTTVTQADPVSAGVNSFSYDGGRSHDQRSYKDPDDCSCVCGGGCRHKTRRQEGIMKEKKREEQQVYQHSRGGVDTCSDWLTV